jgi:hypothetical protein
MPTSVNEIKKNPWTGPPSLSTGGRHRRRSPVPACHWTAGFQPPDARSSRSLLDPASGHRDPTPPPKLMLVTPDPASTAAMTLDLREERG